jgi:D-arabinose 5-phosphate isomerase GutQ/sugar/nucleoside kinase (ribokinase family)
MGIGSNVVDVIYRVNQIAGPEQKTYILSPDAGPVVQEVVGGVTLNHLAWARLLGVPAGLFGYQGDDRYGRIIRRAMDRHRIGRDHIIVHEGVATGFSVIYVDPDAERAIYMFRGPTGTTRADDISRDFSSAIRGAGMVSTEVSQLPLDGVVAVLRTAREAGVQTVLDVDVPPDFCVDVARLGTREQLETVMSLADVLKPAKAAAAQLTQESSPEAQAEALVRRYAPRLTAITDGRRGSVFSDGTRTLRVSAREVEAVDSTGAGDAFLGGLIAGLHWGLTLEQTARLANACGGACCVVVGAFPVPGRSLRDVVSLYGEGWPLSRPDEDIPDDVPDHIAAATLRRESASLEALAEVLSVEAVEQVAQLVLRSERDGGRVHVTGVGKSGHVGRKIAATLKSTGTRAYFLDPLDALHGDSGQVAAGDVVLAISHSGETAELLALAETVAGLGAHVVAMTGSARCALAERCEVVLHVPVPREADPLGLAPTASTTAQLAVGDALAMTLSERRGFTREEFSRYHPGGTLGRQLRPKAD